MSFLLRLQNLKKQFKSGSGKCVNALDDFSFDFAAEDFAVLLGPSGAGKTTLLRIIAGVEAPDAGTIWKSTENITSLPAVNRNIGLVLQSPALLPHLNVLDNIALPLKLRKLSRTEIYNKCNGIAEELGLVGLLKNMPHEISAGEAQRVSLARALVKQPDILLLDEPLANIDASGKAELRQTIDRAAENRLTIYVTHDQNEAMALARTIILMRDGTFVEAGTPRVIYERPMQLFTAKFVGAPKINRLDEIQYIRAEDVLISNSGRPATVERVEYFGSEQHVYLQCEGKRLVSRASASLTIKPGDKLFVELQNIHRFDSKTGHRIENLPRE